MKSRLLAYGIVFGLSAMAVLRGAFPVPYELLAIAAVLAAFVVGRLWRTSVELPADVTTFALAVLLIAYMLAVPGSASLNQSIIGVLAIGAAAGAYWIGRRAFRGERLRLLLFGIAGLSALAAALGLASMVFSQGILHHMVNLTTGRMNGVLEYPNSSGILAAIGVLAVWLAEPLAGSRGKWLRVLGVLSLVALLHTESLGALLFFGLATVLVFIRYRSLWPTMLAVVLGGAVGLKSLHPGEIAGLAFVLAGALISVPLGEGIQRAATWLGARASRRWRWALGAGFSVLLVAAVAVRLFQPLALVPGVNYSSAISAATTRVHVVANGRVTVSVFAQYPDGTTQALATRHGAGILDVKPPSGDVSSDLLTFGTKSGAKLIKAWTLNHGVRTNISFVAARLLPGVLYKRYVDFQSSSYDLTSRWAMFVDGLKMIAQRPIRGWGGGGWSVAYSSVQSFPYVSSEPHNFPEQVAIDAGLIGLLALFGLVVSVAWAYVRRRRRLDDPRAFDAMALLAAVLFAHSWMDWDLAIPALLMMWFVMLGAITGQGEEAQERPLFWRAPVWMGGVAAVGAILLAVGQLYGAQGDVLLNAHKPITALADYQKALRFDPIAASFHYDVAEIEEQLIPISPKAITAAGQSYAAAVHLSPQSYLYRARYGLFLAVYGSKPAALRQLSDAVALAPMRSGVYSVAIGADEWMGYQFLQKHHRQSAVAPLSTAVELANQMQERSAAQPAYVPSNFRLPASVPSVRLYAGLSALFLHRYQSASELLPAMQTSLPKSEAEMLALGETALAKHNNNPNWHQMLSTFNQRFPGLDKSWTKMEAALANPG